MTRTKKETRNRAKRAGASLQRHHCAMKAKQKSKNEITKTKWEVSRWRGFGGGKARDFTR